MPRSYGTRLNPQHPNPAIPALFERSSKLHFRERLFTGKRGGGWPGVRGLFKLTHQLPGVRTGVVSWDQVFTSFIQQPNGALVPQAASNPAWSACCMSGSSSELNCAAWMLDPIRASRSDNTCFKSRKAGSGENVQSVPASAAYLIRRGSLVRKAFTSVANWPSHWGF